MGGKSGSMRGDWVVHDPLVFKHASLSLSYTDINFIEHLYIQLYTSFENFKLTTTQLSYVYALCIQAGIFDSNADTFLHLAFHMSEEPLQSNGLCAHGSVFQEHHAETFQWQQLHADCGLSCGLSLLPWSLFCPSL